MKLIQTAPHEFDAHFLYHGLSGYFACDSVVKSAGGSTGFLEFQTDGETWQARLRYRPSNLVAPRGNTLPTGTTFSLEQVREFALRVRRHPDEDELGKQDFTAHITPRWQGMEGEKSDGTTTEISVPDALSEGINVRVQGSNIAFDRYQKLIRRGLEAVGIAGHHVEHPDHDLSNVTDAARYVRIHRHDSGPIHSRTGTIATMGHLLEDDRTGRRELKQYDSDERGRTVEGYYHTVTLDQRHIREAWPHHRLTKEIKHYRSREAHSFDDDHPLAHPKLEASYQRSAMPYDADPVRTDPEALDKLRDELHEAVLSVLEDSGLDLSPTHGTGPFVRDPYFRCRTSEQEPPASLDLDQLEHEQENLVISTLARTGGLSPVENEALETLLADGGKVSPQQIADEHGRHYDSVTRALRRIDPILERQRERVALKSPHIAGLVHQAIDEARDTLERAARTVDAAQRAVKQGLKDVTASFVAWCEKHGIDYRDQQADGLEIELGEQPSSRVAHDRLRAAWRRWRDAGRDESRFRTGTATFETPKGRRTIDVWRVLG